MANDKFDNEIPHCSFCGRGADDPGVGQIVSSPLGASICSECLKACEEVLNPSQKKKVKAAESTKDPIAELKVPKPAEIKAELDKFVIGQNDAKRFFPLPCTIITSGFRHIPRPLRTTAWILKKAMSC